MHNFFKGWKRKAGCVTLVMAALLVGPWIRSLAYEDILLRFGLSDDYFASGRGSIQWSTLNQIHDPARRGEASQFTDRAWRWETRQLPDQAGESHPISLIGPEQIRELNAVVWVRKAFGFEFAVIDYTTRRTKERFRRGQWIIPYWSIVLPLTLLSAWLLLSKPRSQKPKST